MKVMLDEIYSAMADVAVPEFVRKAIANNADVHTSQMIVITCLRGELVQIPSAQRPQVEWVFYGKTVTFDKDLRSNDAWDDPRTSIEEDALFKLMGP